MFKKPPTLGTSTSLKNSDRRNLIKELCERYSNITIEKCKSTIFSEGLKQCKATTSNGDYLTLFTSSNGLPVAFRIGKGEQGALIPTGVLAFYHFPAGLSMATTILIMEHCFHLCSI